MPLPRPPHTLSILLLRSSLCCRRRNVSMFNTLEHPAIFGDKELRHRINSSFCFFVFPTANESGLLKVGHVLLCCLIRHRTNRSGEMRGPDFSVVVRRRLLFGVNESNLSLAGCNHGGNKLRRPAVAPPPPPLSPL